MTGTTGAPQDPPPQLANAPDETPGGGRSKPMPREEFADELDRLITPLRVIEGAQRRVAAGALTRRHKRQNLQDERRPMNNQQPTPTRTEDPATEQTNLENKISSWVNATALPKTQTELDYVIHAIADLTKPTLNINEQLQRLARMRQLYTSARTTPPLTPDQRRRRLDRRTNRRAGHTTDQAAQQHKLPAQVAVLADQQNPTRTLGLHPAITVTAPAAGAHNDRAGTETLTAYLERDHDPVLRGHLRDLAAAGRPRMVIVTGNSCAGKTRTLYEAVTHTDIAGWPITTPTNPAELTEFLTQLKVGSAAGAPDQLGAAGTIVWLDELQKLIPATPDGDTAARALAQLLEGRDAPPVALLATIWPEYLRSLQNPHTGDPTGGYDVAALLEDPDHRIDWVEVPDTFTDTQLAHAASTESITDDPRMRVALDTARQADPDSSNHGQITQILAGGTQLVSRMHPDTPRERANAFNDTTRALLHAACDLRRIGHPNPLPEWAILSAALGYLDRYVTSPAARARLAPDWTTTALAEALHAARETSPEIGRPTHNIYVNGPPALTPHHTTGPDDTTQSAYDLHDYLYQDHLTRHRYTPTAQELWTTLTDRSSDVDAPTLTRLARDATSRGLFALAILLHQGSLAREPKRVPKNQRFLHPGGPSLRTVMLVTLLLYRSRNGDDGALEDLRKLADSSSLRRGRTELRYWLVFALRERAESGDEKAFEDLGALSKSDPIADYHFAEARLTRNPDDREAEAVVQAHRRRSIEFTANIQVDGAGNPYEPEGFGAWVQSQDAKARADELTRLAKSGDSVAFQELETEAARGDQEAQECLAELLLERGDTAALTGLTHAASAGAAESLIDLYRRRSAKRRVLGLDTDAMPELSKVSWLKSSPHQLSPLH